MPSRKKHLSACPQAVFNLKIPPPHFLSPSLLIQNAFSQDSATGPPQSPGSRGLSVLRAFWSKAWSTFPRCNPRSQPGGFCLSLKHSATGTALRGDGWAPSFARALFSAHRCPFNQGCGNDPCLCAQLEAGGTNTAWPIFLSLCRII